MMQDHLPPRRIAHLDMDAFFASVELLTYAELRGSPVVVGGRNTAAPALLRDGSRRYASLGDYVVRCVVTTSTYEARALGVFSGMGLMQSAKLAPQAILLPANFDAYRDNSKRFKVAVAAIAPRIENRGIEENSQSLAQRLKQAVWDATGLSCSIGITPNKLLSKICSDLDKPNGITILAMEDLQARIWPLATKKINGIGPKAYDKLKGLGIHTIGELAATPLTLLLEHFGTATGEWLHRVAHGIDERPVVMESEPKSISRESTFERDLHAKTDRASLSEIFTGLCVRVSEDLKRKGYACKTIGIKLRYADFQPVTRDVTLAAPIVEANDIRQAAGECLRRVPLSKRIRLLGVRASGLVLLSEMSQNRVPAQAELFN